MIVFPSIIEFLTPLVPMCRSQIKQNVLVNVELLSVGVRFKLFDLSTTAWTNKLSRSIKTNYSSVNPHRNLPLEGIV